MDDRQNLRKRLERLHRELQQVEDADGIDRPILEELMADIQELLDRKEEHGVPSYSRLAQRLKTSIQQFEASYPRASRAMGEAAEVLANMGI